MADTARPLRAAVIGYGLAGSVFHAPLVAATPGMQVAAIVTRDEERRAEARRAHPGAALLDGADRIWAAAGEYDLVVVATPNRTHAPLAIAALDAGLPVVVDKPMAGNSADARAMVDASRRAGKLLTVFHNRRWDGDFLTARRLLEAGTLGAPIRLESRFERFRPAPREGAWRELGDAAEAGGVLWDLGPHLIDQARVLFGDPARVYAEVDRRRPGVQVDDDAFVVLRFPGGESAQLWMSQTAPIQGPRLRVSGLGGGYEHAELDGQEAALRAGLRPGDPEWGREAPEHRGRLAIGGDHPEGRRIETERGAWERFYAGVRDALTGGGPPPVAPEDGLRAIELIEAARRSAETGQVVELGA
jgi:scyllo-inositol 2-dehydrogenase (NADP+)